MELKKYFGYDGILNTKTAENVWNICNNVLVNEQLSVRKIIKQSNVEVICTTDEPIDSLQWHKKVEEDGFEVKVLPAWRPDKIVNIEKDDFAEYIKKLGAISNISIKNVKSLKSSIKERIIYFSSMGCSISDHGLDFIPYSRCPENELEEIFIKALNHKAISTSEVEKYKTEILIFLAAEYKERNWVMQLHYGCHRNNNTIQFTQLGSDTGYDCISNYTPSNKIISFLDDVSMGSGLPKTILYSLNPNDNPIIDSIIGSFQNSDVAGKIQHGSAWWFNDNKKGIEEQLTSLANLGVLGKFVGMLTDSRSFLSYTRHDYFRRILCNTIGNWVENGYYPADDESLSKIVKGIAYFNAKYYFNF